ncbi:MAG: hypothetical protein JW708_08935 [Vallitaleaceae bacterium]|nr:hypothetical protein [Vallitaleaceae bacterium]
MIKKDGTEVNAIYLNGNEKCRQCANLKYDKIGDKLAGTCDYSTKAILMKANNILICNHFVDKEEAKIIGKSW